MAPWPAGGSNWAIVGPGWTGQATPPPGKFKDIAAEQDFSMGVREGGSLAYWGSDRWELAGVPSGEFTAVTFGFNYAMALRADGTIAAWGWHNPRVVENVPSGTFKAIEGMGVLALALRSDGTLVAWGPGLLWTPPPGTYTAIAGGYLVGMAIACYADCDHSQSLTIADFGCFQTQFIDGNAEADCNQDSALTIADFACFQNRFVVGCE